MVTIALIPVLQVGPLLQHLVSLGAPFCVDQWQCDWVGSDFLHQSQPLMSVYFEKKNRLKGPTLVWTNLRIGQWLKGGKEIKAPRERLRRTEISNLSTNCCGSRNIFIEDLGVSSLPRSCQAARESCHIVFRLCEMSPFC